jgi:hypothetical protein
LWNPDRCNHPSVCRFLVRACSMPRTPRPQGRPKQPVPPFPTSSNTPTAPTRRGVSGASPSFPIPWIGFSPAVWLSRWQRQRPDPPQNRSEHSPRQTPLGQQAPVVPGMFHHAPTGLDQPLLHAGQRPVVGPLRQCLPPQEPQIVGQHARRSARFMAQTRMALG